MDLKKFIKKERLIWHKYFLPSLLAGICVGIIAWIFELTISNILLFASVGASAVILTHSTSHHLVKLRTTIKAYIIAIIVSFLFYGLRKIVHLDLALAIAIMVFIMGIFLFAFDAFHPPAITAALSFLVLDRILLELFYLFLAIIALLVLIRFITYIFEQKLSIKNFFHEFKGSLIKS